MSDFQIFCLMLLPTIGISTLVLNIIFKNSFIKILILSIASICASMGVSCYYIAMEGLHTFIILAPANLVVIVGSLFYIKKHVSDPVRALSTIIVNHLSIGDLSVEIDEEMKAKNNEFGEISTALDTMTIGLRKLISEIQDFSGQLLSASDEQRLSADKISEGASQQASSAEELASSIEEITANIQQNSESSTATSAIYKKMRGEIERVNHAVEHNTQSVQQIAEKVSIIDDISSQTNVLALNASVEAVRAGKSGKGFSVVASEVRKLAEISKYSAQEINDLVEVNV